MSDSWAFPTLANPPSSRCYPTPNLKSPVAYRDYQSFVIADIPGIIEGASEGKGIGLRFLRHIERNSILLFLIPVISEDIKKEYNILFNELRAYNPELVDKKRIIAITKCDLIDDDELKRIQKKVKLPDPTLFISSISKKNLTQLKDILWEELSKEQNQVIEISHSPLDIERVERQEAEAGNQQDDEEHTIYLNEVEEEWDLSKYAGIGWDTQDNG